jgi:predicted CXXCH cytochrome family protein
LGFLAQMKTKKSSTVLGLAVTGLAVLVGLVMFYGNHRTQMHPQGHVSSAETYAAPGSCANCHAGIAASYAHTGMAHSFYRPTTENMVEDYAKGAKFYHELSKTYFGMSHRDGKFFQKRWQTGYAGDVTNVDELQIDYVMGSGNHVRTYLHRNANGTLVELPLAWYAEKGGHWGMNPGYDNTQPLSRHTISYECMFCHNGYPNIPEPQSDTVANPAFTGELPEGVDCQRCHGPGGRHVEAAKKAGASVQEIRAAILNPARLSPDRRMEVCMQCHLETTSRHLPDRIRRYDQAPFGYDPNKPLNSFWQYFAQDLSPMPDRRDDRFEIVNAAYRLRQSQCYLQSKGAVTCESCHDPHQPHQAEAAEKKYVAACLSCHQTALTQLIVEKRHTTQQDCVSCHMPKRRTDDVVHAVMTDHLIQRLAPFAGKLLAEKKEITETDANSYRGEVKPYRVDDYRAGDEALYTATAQVMHNSNLAAGIPQLSSAIAAQHPASPEFSIELGDALRRSGDIARAVAAYRDALNVGPTSSRARRSLGVALSETGQPDQAISELKTGLQREPDNPLLWYQLGLIHSQQGPRDEAVTELKKAIQLDPDLAEAYNNLGIDLAGMGDRQGAEQAFRTAIRINPYDAGSQANLGQFVASHGDWKQAAFHFEKAVSFDPKQANARYAYATVLAQLNRIDEAERQAEAAISIDQTMPQAHDLLGLLLGHKGKGDAAIAEFRKALQIDLAFGPSHLNLAVALAHKGDRAGALEQLEAAASSSQPEIAAQAREMELKLKTP